MRNFVSFIPIFTSTLYFDKVRFVNKKLIFIFRMMLHDFGERKRKKERYTMCI